MSINCPIECVGVGCPQPDFIERNGTWLLTLIGVIIGCFSSLLTYFLKSRCSKIKCCGVELDRQVIELKKGDFELDTSSSKA